MLVELHCGVREGTARGGRAALAGVTAHKRCAATRLCGVLPIRHGFRRDTFPAGEGAGLIALGRGSPTVAPLRVRLVPSVMGARGGDLLRRLTEVTHAPPGMRRVRRTISCLFRQRQGRRGSSSRPANPRATRAATVPPGRLRTSDMSPTFPHAAPARKRLASLHNRFRPQIKRRGVRGQPWRMFDLAAPGRPLVLSREWERTPHSPAQRAKERRAPPLAGHHPLQCQSIPHGIIPALHPLNGRRTLAPKEACS